MTGMSEAGQEFYRVTDTSGELMGEFPSSRLAREFAQRMIEAGKAGTLVVEWSNNGRRGELAVTRKSLQAVDQRVADARLKVRQEARRRANLISGIAIAIVGLIALLEIAATWMESRGGF